MEKEDLHKCEEYPTTDTEKIAKNEHISQSTFFRMLKNQLLGSEVQVQFYNELDNKPI